MSEWELMPSCVEQSMETLGGPGEYHWVWDGKYTALARWIPYRWHMGAGLAYNTCKITHFHPVVPPSPPERNKKNGWVKSPPEFEPFYQSWCWDGKYTFLASWRDGEWKIGRGLAFTPDEVTHYQILKAPEPPNLIQEKSVSNEVNYADL